MSTNELRPWQLRRVTTQCTAATWYAFGRNDAGSTRVDPQAFGMHYAAKVAASMLGATYCPSIQAAWTTFAGEVTS